MKYRSLILFLASVLLSIPAFAQLSPKYPCSDHMVLQQQTSALVWGHGDAGKTVKVTTSWDHRSYRTTTGEDGVWRVYVSTPAASYKHYEINVKSGSEKYTISDVLVGEVWIASGQSNMEMPLRGFNNCPTEGYMDIVSNPAGADEVRMLTVDINPSFEVLKDVEKTYGWRKAVPSEVSEMSATAYFFAEQLNRTLNVPVGILALPRGGARVESWLPKATVEGYGTEDCSREAVEKLNEYVRPYLMYNGMEQPVKGYTARGFIWYQGCSNVGAHDVFVPRMTELVRQWREDWSDSTNAMPFYQVEIAPFVYEGKDGESSALLRAAQHKAAATIPNSAIVCTNDLAYDYELTNIHPCQKRPVGLRLAYLALHRDYGFGNLPCYSPEAISVSASEKDPSTLFVKCINCSCGTDRMRGIEGLEVAGEDGIFRPVDSVCMWQDNILTVECKGIVDAPKAIRYGWANFRPGNLHSCYGLPFVPFSLSVE